MTLRLWQKTQNWCFSLWRTKLAVWMEINMLILLIFSPWKLKHMVGAFAENLRSMFRCPSGLVPSFAFPKSCSNICTKGEIFRENQLEKNSMSSGIIASLGYVTLGQPWITAWRKSSGKCHPWSRVTAWRMSSGRCHPWSTLDNSIGDPWRRLHWSPPQLNLAIAASYAFLANNRNDSSHLFMGVVS